MTKPDAISVETPQWEVLNLPDSSFSKSPVAPKELVVIDDNKALITTGSLMSVAADQEIPSFRSWKVTNGVASTSDDKYSLIAVSPIVLAKIEEAKNRPDGWLMKFTEITSGMAPAEVGLFGGLFAGFLGGMALTGNNVISGLASVGTAAAGFFGGLHLLGYGSPLHKIALSSEARHNEAVNRGLSAMVRGSEDTFAIPNRGRLTEGLGKDVVKLLGDAEGPDELLRTKVAPLVSAIMQAEVELATIEPEVAKIEARSIALEATIESDAVELAELTAKKKSLEGFANLSRKQLDAIHGDELKMKAFKEKLLELSPGKLELTPELREFCDGVADVIRASYEPKFSESAGNAIDDIAEVMKTVADEKILAEIYEALREKWAPAGIQVPDYETLQDQIAQGRELR